MADGGAERWRYRFENYDRSLILLREAVALSNSRPLSELEKGGLIQRFEVTWELGWKTLGDYLREIEDPDIALTPGSSIRYAVAVKLVDDGDAWLNAGKLRNTLSHEYSEAKRDEGLVLIEAKFLPMMEKLHAVMLSKANDA